MRRAVDLSRQGFPAPNPRVGCVLVNGGEIVGEGYHDHAGGPHAEVVALEAAGTRAKGAHAYVTLEPCNHQGRTGPCSVALAEAGVSAVTYAVPDPNPRARGGSEALRSAGVKVEAGLLASEAAAANATFLTAHRLARPVVVVKVAMGLDGRVALPSGESRWITGEAARERVHRLRAEMGCVLVGSGTAERDRARLTARVPGVVNQPLRVILDPDGQTGADLPCYSAEAPSLRLVAEGKATRSSDATLSAPEGRFDLRSVLGTLWDRGVIGVLVEGGPGTWGRFLEAGLADQLKVFVAPRVLGAGPSWMQGAILDRLGGDPAWQLAGVERLGDDVLLTLTTRA